MNLIHILQIGKVEWTIADNIDLFGGYLDLFIGPAVSLTDKAEGKFTTDQLLVIVSGIVLVNIEGNFGIFIEKTSNDNRKFTTGKGGICGDPQSP